MTRRSEEKSRALIDDFPHLVEVIDDIQDIINRSDILFIGSLLTVCRNFCRVLITTIKIPGLLPAVARLILPPLSFGGGNRQFFYAKELFTTTFKLNKRKNCHFDDGRSRHVGIACNS